MSENKTEPPNNDTPTSKEVKADAAKGAAKDVAKPVKSKGYSNPALRMMGLPVLRLPSRNWMIFWTVLAFGAGGIVYDKYQQKQIRQKWMDRVSKYGEKKLGPNELARRVTVYIAPPPSDYLDESVAVFRRYVKPILNSAGIDFKIQSEDRQGVIRSVVAAEIRSLRREILANDAKLKQLKDDAKWYNRLKNWVLNVKNTKKNREAEEQALLNKKFTDDLNFANVLGVYYKNIHKDDKVRSEDADITEPSMQGGVICIGRGAYKEYLHGLHEGLLGPLEKPLDHDEFEKFQQSSLEEKPEETEMETVEPPKVQSLNEIYNSADENSIETNVNNDINDEVNEAPNSDKLKDENKSDNNENSHINKSNTLEDELAKAKAGTEDDEESEGEVKKLPIPKPFIASSDYAKAQFAPELKFNSKIPTQSDVSPFLQQPILVIPVYHLLGFLKTPQRIYRFYTKRRLTEEYGKSTVALVESLQSPFSLNDIDWAKDEEEDWPKKWVKAGLEKQSEWTTPLVTDERVLSKLNVYDADRVVTVNPVEKK